MAEGHGPYPWPLPMALKKTTNGETFSTERFPPLFVFWGRFFVKKTCPQMHGELGAMAFGHAQGPWPMAMAHGYGPWPWPMAMAIFKIPT